MMICAHNARTLASGASIEDLMIQARKTNYTRGRGIGPASTCDETDVDALYAFPQSFTEKIITSTKSLLVTSTSELALQDA
ncbi:hypothetical protein RB195_024192 [Necator americanus]|uniref:Uncharacterized protein n=1 Tax=Necator americanus TaxID=51031 RepID=A0ABR1EMB0_NECAM